MLKAVIFDLNGVFLESELFSERFEKSYGVSTYEFVSALKDVMAVARKPGLVDAFALWKPYLDKWKVFLDKDQFFSFWFSGEHLVPELIEYSNKLRVAGIKVLILSNNFKERTEYYRSNFPQLFQATDKAYFSWETGFVKPDENAYKLILRDVGVKAEDCMYFDDSDKNIEVARSLGFSAHKYEGLEKAKSNIESSGISSRRPENHPL